MKYVMLNPSKLEGIVTVPSSKSICHRAIICAGLSKGVSNISNVNFSKDIEATCKAMENLDVSITKDKSILKIEGPQKLEIINPDMKCNESGSTLRFMIPIAAVTGEKAVFNGEGELVRRPLTPYVKIFDDQNIKYTDSLGQLPLTIEGRLKPGEYKIEGNISSQFITGLLFALPLLDGDSKIIISSELESKPYVDLTLDVLKDFGIDIENVNYREFLIKGKQQYKAQDIFVEGDFSQAAFWLVAGTLGAGVHCQGLNIESLQGDKEIINIIENMGGKISIEKDIIRALPSDTKGIVFDGTQCPDLVPILAVLGALSEGTTEIVNASRLRIKECDRLKAICSELKRIGANIEEKPDGLIIKGKKSLLGGQVNSWGDHRIAMALAIASIRCKEPVIINDADCVKKSYPNFWKDFKKVGGIIDEWSVGK